MIPFRPIYRKFYRHFLVPDITGGIPWIHGVARYSSSSSVEQTQSAVADAFSLQHAFLEKRKDPAETFRACFLDNSLTKEVAFVCLQHVDSSNKLETNTGSAALEWFWNNRNTYVEPDDNMLLYLIVRLMVREGREEKLWHWMDSRAGNPKTPRALARSKWRGLILKGIIKTKAEFQKDPHSLDDALNAYFSAKNRKNGHGIPLFPGFRFLYDQLARPVPVAKKGDETLSNSRAELVRKIGVWKVGYPNTNLDLWTRFYEEAGRDIGPRKTIFKVRKYRQASLMLNHPQNPDPKPMFLVFQNMDSDSTHPWQEMGPLGAWRSQARHTQDLFHKMEKPEEAAWVQKFIEKRLSRAVVWKQEKTHSEDKFGTQDESGFEKSAPAARTLPPLPPKP